MLDLPRFGEHLISWEKGVHDVYDTSALCIRAPGVDDRAGLLGPLSGTAGPNAQAVERSAGEIPSDDQAPEDHALLSVFCHWTSPLQLTDGPVKSVENTNFLASEIRFSLSLRPA